ncbi:MAG: hypothetical protein Q7U16_11720 [Agitococcus sp.]|nr:hypothetical protein [Agitococcus sp.]
MANRHTAIIWDADVYGTPKDYDANTLEQAEALANQEATPSAKLLAFARDIEIYSQNNGLDPIVLRYLRNFEKKVIAANTAAFCIELPEYQWRSLLKILIEVAQKHKLVLFDEQLVLLLLPDGSILPPHTARSWQGTLEELENESGFPQTLLEFNKLITTKIGGLLSEYGFVLDIDDSDENDIYLKYLRKTSSGLHKLSFMCEGGDGEFQLKTYLILAEDNIIAVCNQSDFKYPTDAGGGVFLNTPILLQKNINFFSIINWDSFEGLLLKLRQSPLRWSDAVQDIKGIDALFNGDIDEIVRNRVQRAFDMPYCLVAARLANNPNFEKLAVSLGEADKCWPANMKTAPLVAWPKLVKYLREEVKPLV